MSPFDAAIKAAAVTHDSIMGELFEYRPMTANTDPLAPIIVDPARAVVLNLLAVWGDPSAREMSGAARTPGVKAERPGHATTRPFLSVDLSRLPYVTTEGDIVIRIKTGARFRVAEVLPSEPGFVRLDLNKV